VDRDATFILSWDFLVSFFDIILPVIFPNKCRYVAMQAMQEDGSPHSHEHSNTNGYADSGSGAQRKPTRPQMRDTFAAVGGMLLPLLTQIGHHH